MKDDAVIKDNEAVYLLNEQTYLHLRENLEGVGYEVFDKNSPLPVEEGQIPREVLGNTQRRIETARAYYLAEHQDEPVGKIQNVAVTTLEKFRSGVRKRRNLAPRSLPDNDVRFIDPQYNELFRVPDGSVVQMTYPDGHQRSEVVEYLDDYHMKIGSSVQHICEFAERMARSRAIVEPEPLTQQDCRAWNLEYDYYVRRGSKGIALLDESSGFPRLHYVFDVSDTGVRRNSRDPEMWQYNDDLKQPVSEMLSKTYGISGERVSQQLADVAGKLVADYWDNNGGDIRAIVDGSLLMDYDEAGVEMQFKSAAAISVTYTLLERCGFEPAGWFDKDDFRAIHEFSTPDSVYALGAAVSDMSREVLRNIERTVKTTIRRRNAERSQYEYEQQERDLLDRRGLPAPEPDPEPAPEAAGQVRQAAPDVPERPSPSAVQHDAPEREPVPAPDGGGADGREPDAADHSAASETEPGPGQGAESDGMGAAHEQPESAGRGTGAERTDLQLSFFDAHIPTEVQQIEKIDQAESEKTPSAFSLSQAEIENELRKHGSGFEGGKQRIMALYQTQPDRNLRAKALAKEYGTGGHSHDFLDGSRGFVNHDWKGLEFDHYPDHQKITLKWAQVEKYIDLMIQSDRYLTDKEKEHYTPPSPVSAKPDADLTHAKNLIREFCQEEYDSEPDFSDLTKIGIAGRGIGRNADTSFPGGTAGACPGVVRGAGYDGIPPARLQGR